MKKLSIPTTLLLLAVSLSSCELFKGVFKAGMAVGIFIVVAIIAVIIFIISRIFGR